MIDNSTLKVGDNVWIRSVQHNWSASGNPVVQIERGVVTKVSPTRIYIDCHYTSQRLDNIFKLVFEYRKTKRLTVTNNYTHTHYSLFSSEVELQLFQNQLNDKRDASEKLKKEFDSKYKALTIEQTLKLLEFFQKI